MPSFQVTWHLLFRSEDAALRVFVTSLNQDSNVASVVVTEARIAPFTYVDVTLIRNVLQPRLHSLRDLHTRYPTNEGANVEEVVLEDLPEHFTPETRRAATHAFVQEVTSRLTARAKPLKPRLPDKTVFDHLLADDDDEPV
jgi:hypothetical protein